MKAKLFTLVKRFCNYGSLVAVAAFIVNNLLTSGIIPTQHVGNIILTIVHYALYLLVLAGVVNNPEKITFKSIEGNVAPFIEKAAEVVAPVIEQAAEQKLVTEAADAAAKAAIDPNAVAVDPTKPQQ